MSDVSAPEYSVTFARSASREVQKLSPKTADRILAKVERLAHEPRPRGCKKLQGATELWRIRVGGFRVVYKIDDRKKWVDVIVVRQRKDAYRH